jgi:excinuclease UvrABC nuclease subunit
MSSLFGNLAPVRTQNIQFKNRIFTDPCNIRFASIPSSQGIYAVMVADTTAKPRPYRVIYFGEAVNMSKRLTRSHEKYSEWVRAANGGPLYVAFHFTANMSDEQRRSAENELICHYNPCCNIKADHSAAMWKALGLG